LPTPWLRSSNQPAILPPRPLRLFGGAAIAAGVALLVVLVLWSIASAAYGQPETSPLPDVPHLLRMSAIQAALSTVLSLVIGTALAWSLNRLRFPGRNLAIGLFASAIVTPGLIVAFGLLAVWGRSGWINAIAQALFHTPVDTPIFGLAGILAAHVILDAAFAARILLARLDAIPTTRLKTGQGLALTPLQRFAIIDWPALRGTIPGLAAIIFLLAFTSFPIVLLLGGGPANQTLEVAIYSAVRLDFNLHGAVILALAQIGFCSIIIFAASAFAPIPSSLGPSTGQSWSDRGFAKTMQWIVLAACVIGFALPLLAVLAGGFSLNLFSLLSRPSFASALATSLVLGALSAVLTLVLALALGSGRAATGRPLLRIGLAAPAYAYLAVPAVVLALGFFLLVRTMGIEPAMAGPAVVILGNALLSLPFAIATLGPPLEAVATGQGKLIRSLGLSGWRQFALVEWPLLGREIGVVFALAFCFSLGDLGIISFFGTQDFSTLPLLLLRSLGAYRTDDAAIVAAIMLVITVGAFTALPQLFARWSNAQA
jgi:thiamine transport system permease protein